MRKGSSYRFMKCIIGLLWLCTTAIQASAQTDITIGSGTTGNSSTGYPCPIQDYYEGNRSQFLYQASELAAAGMGPGSIVAVKFNVLSLNGTGVVEKMVVRVGATSSTSLSTNSWDVFNGAPAETPPTDYQPVTGVNTIMLPSSFVWNGTDNILVEVCNGDPNNNNGTYYTNNPTTPWTTNLGFNGSHTYISDNLGSLCGTTSTFNSGTQTTRPDIIFSWVPATACAGKPTAGMAVSSAGNVCLAQNFTLSLSGGTVASGITYQWQSSPNNSTWTNMPGATFSTYTTSQSTTNWYRAIVTCGGSISDTSTVVQVISPALVGGIFTINGAQATGGSNFQSFNDAINYIKCGINTPVVFNVVPGGGPYNEQVTIPAIPGSSATNTITINGNGASLVYSPTTSAARTAIVLDGADHFIFDSLNIDVSGGTYGWGMLLINKADSNIIRHCTITSNTSSTSGNYSGILLNGSTTATFTAGDNGNGNLISGNTIIGGYYGIFMYGTAGNNIGNIIEKNIVKDVYNGFIYAYGITNVTIRGNDISRPNRSSVTTTYGIYVGAIGALVEKNRVHNLFDAATTSSSAAYCLYVAMAGSATQLGSMQNNLVYNINNGAGTVYGIYSLGYNYWNFYHNTLVLDDGTATSGTTYGCYVYGSSNVNVKDNLVYITRGGTGTKYGLYFSSTGVTASANNDLYINAPAGTNNVGYYNSAYTSLAAWQATGFDVSSVSYDPQFVSASSGNYTPTSALLDNMGVPVGVTTDINNAARSTATPDIGAIEFTSPACTSPPVPGTIATSANPVCVGVNFTLSLSGSSVGSGQTYQWQSSPDNTTWTNITGAVSATYTTSQTTSTWYRVGVTCSGSTVYSAAMQEITNGVVYTTLPFTESFEDTWINGCDNRDIPNNFWRSHPATGNNSWRRNDDGAAAVWTSPASGAYTPAASAGSYSARFHSYYASFGTSGMLDLYVNCNTGVPTKRLKFDYINTSGSDSLQVLLSTDGGLTFTKLAGYYVNGTWDKKTLNLTSTSATTVLRFLAVSDFGVTDIGIDNLSLFDLQDCSGAPAGGTTVSSSATVCPGSTFTLSVNSLPLANGITYQWQSSADNVTWNNISGATAETYTTSQTVATWYRMVITCTLSTQSTNTTAVQVGMRTPAYTTLPYTESFENTWINGCDTRDVPNNFWTDNPVTDNNSWRRNDDGASANWSSDLGAYNPTASAGTYSARFHSYDASFGSQGKFDLHINANTGIPNKRLTFSAINTSGSDSLSILISTDGGVTFTRVDSVGNRSAWSGKTIYFNATSATTVIRFEATSDFGVTDIGIDDLMVADWPDCSGTPNGGTTTTTTTTACVDPFTLSVTGVSTGNGITYQWQQSTDSLTWTNIPGATSLTLTTSQVGTHYYRLLVSCNLSSTSAASTPVQIISPTPVSGTFNINNSLPTGGINFNSFNDAYNYIKCGINGPVLFNVAAGTGVYNEQLIMTPVPGSSAVNTVTFKGDGAAAIGFAASNTNERAVIKLRGAAHIIFDSLIINANTGTYGYGVQLMSNTDSNTVKNCTINLPTTSTSQNFAGIVVNGDDASAVTTGTVLSDYNNFSGNTIIGGYYGITLVASFNGGANGNNIIRGNIIKDFYQYGIYVAGSFATIIEKNTISRPTRTTLTDFYGIYFTAEKNAGCSISKNRITNPFGGDPTNTGTFYGINFNNSSGSTGGTYNENTVSNNLIYNINGNGAEYAIANTGSSYAYYFHNTISLDNIASTSSSATRGFYQTTTAGGIFFYNNIISITRGGAGAKHCIYLAASLPAGEDNNDYYINAAAGSNNVGYYTANRALLSNWKSATGLDANALSITPAFVDPANGNYTPGNAGIDNKGIGIGITDDILDQPRDANTPDIGCYEFTPSPCSLPLVNGAVTITPDTICQYNPVYLHLNIGAFGSGQTFQWQMAKSLTGAYTNIGTPMLTPDTTITADTTAYFRVLISCGAHTVYSDTVQLVVHPALPNGTYTINKNAPGTYIPGIPGGNFVSFNDAKAAMGCGIGGPVVFNVVSGSGPYNEQLILDSIPNTSAINTITFNGNGNTLTYAATVNNQRATLKFNGVDHVIFDSLVIAATGTTNAYGVQLINNADSNTVRRCTINVPVTPTTTTFAGVVINASDADAIAIGSTFCDGNTFDHNTITGGYYGITLVGNSVQLTINDNRFTNNTIREFYTYGFYISGAYNTAIAGNTFTRPTRTNTASTVYALYINGNTCDRLSVSKNRFHTFFGGITGATPTLYGIYQSVGASVSDTVSNNLLYDLDGNGPIYAIYNTGSNNVLYYHNTISLDNTLSTATGLTAGFYQTQAATGIQFINNIITVSRGGTGSKYGIYLNATVASEVLSDYNDFFVSGANTYTGFWLANQPALTDWQTASGGDAHSFGMNPLYTDAANGNYMPQLAALDNKGTPSGIATDILNVTRSATTPDIGAYEFAPQPCQNPPIAGTAIVTPNSGLCLETPIDLNVTGNSPLGAITFQWQSSPDGSTWTNISPVQYFPQFSTKASLSTYYRAAVTCGTATTYTPAVQVTLNNILLSGTYTIDPSLPATLPNFTSFQSAVNAMLCGISGPIVFKVAAGTYNEQIRIPYIPNTSAVNTVTFKSANGVASSVNLTTSATAPANYTLKLDSTKYFTFTNLTISGTNTANGRVVEIANTASYNHIDSCIISAPVATTPSTNVVGIYASLLKGTANVIKGNTINNGSSGIYFSGTSTGNGLSPDHIIDSNTITGSWQYGIYTSYIKHLQLNKNNVTVNGTVNATAYGIYATDCDSAYTITGNNVTVSNTSSLIYALAVVNCDSSVTARGKVTGNNIAATTGNTGSLYGLYLSNSPGMYVANNVVALNTTGASSYGLYHNNFSVVRYYNNSIHSTATSLTNNYAAYIQNSTATDIQMRNNIFSHKGGGKALYVNNSTQAYTSDYNMLYTSGATLVQRANPAGNYATLNAWRTASYWDKYSITYTPAFVSDNDLHPDLANPDVWAMQGRGVQIAGNNYDFYNNPRPVALTDGVPDLGAFEFFPTATPTVLTATPATPAANATQTFMYGTDTVMKITWGATAPASLQAYRYSGVVPAGLQPRPDSMFFYTRVAIPGGGNYDYNMELFYIDPWQGSVPDQNTLGLGKTTASNAWVVGFSSKVDVTKKKITQTSVNYVDRFTGLVNPYAPPVLPEKDSSNRGKRFWVGYQRSWDFNNGNSQDMVLYMSTLDQPANVQVRVNGTNWVRNYIIPPFTTQASDYLPKTGLDDARLLDEGLYDRGISIVSDVPITAYAHIFASTNSGASMLFPVGVWGYEYYSLNNTQNYTATDSYTTIMVVADRDNTKVEITPSVPTLGGKPANVPFTVTLNAGEVYQVLGAMISGADGYDLTGSIIKSVPNAAGECFPIGVFTGSSRTSLSCTGTAAGSGDLLLQQTFPYSAWGKTYLTAPTSTGDNISSFMTNIYRVLVKDPTTVVKRNNVQLPLASIINNRYYEFNSNTADIITADKPVTVVQYMSSSGACANTNGDGDPDSYILSPAEQAISGFSGFYRNNLSAIDENYLTLILPDSGMNSLKIDGIPWASIPAANKFSYPHNQPGYTVAIKKWPAGAGQSSVESDSAYLGLVYGLGSVESYGYNVGTMVKTLQGLGTISNTLSGGSKATYTCAGTPFRFTGYLPFIPNSLTWKFSMVPGLSPNADVTVINPVPSDSIYINGVKNYVFPVNQDYTFANPGVYTIEIVYEHPDIESCDHTGRDLIYVQVVPAPKADFTINFSGCVKDIAEFIGETVAQNGIAVNQWKWTFHDGSKANGQHVTYTYNAPGTYTENLQSITADGCIGDTTKKVVVNPTPVVTANAMVVCIGKDTTLSVNTPDTSATYKWYASATVGTVLGTGPTLAITNVTANTDYYVQETAGGCTSAMVKVPVTVQSVIAKPVAAVDSVTSNLIRFRWTAVPGATGYQVSLDNGTTWITPSSGSTGLTHTVAGLQPMQTVTLIVRALGTCANSVSPPVSQQVLPDGIFIPNSFTPNGDGLNDVLRVYGYKIKELKFAVFNQWGEQLFETSDQSRGWDGTYRGRQQPSGVYMYVCRLLLTDGTTVDKRGAINLIR